MRAVSRRDVPGIVVFGVFIAVEQLAVATLPLAFVAGLAFDQVRNAFLRVGAAAIFVFTKLERAGLGKFRHNRRQ